jgi:hypothetical protein
MVKDEYIESKLNLLQTIIKDSRLPWHWFTIVLIFSLLLLLIIAAMLDRATGDMRQWDFWRQFLGAPVLIGYIFLIIPYMMRLDSKAKETFQQIFFQQNSYPDDAGYIPRRRWEWVAFIAGAAFWILLQQPWSWDWIGERLWLNLYALVTYAILFGLLGWLIYYSFTGSRYMNRLSRRKLNIDIFNTHTLTPVARASLGTSFAFIGGISLSLIFQTVDSLLTWQNIVIYAILVIATLVIFFLSMWSTHRTMATSKNAELVLVRQQLNEGIRKLKESVSDDSIVNTNELNSAVAAWGIYERRVQEAQEWPFNANILRRLAASTLLPAIVYGVKVLVGTRLI